MAALARPSGGAVPAMGEGAAGRRPGGARRFGTAGEARAAGLRPFGAGARALVAVQATGARLGEGMPKLAARWRASFWRAAWRGGADP